MSACTTSPSRKTLGFSLLFLLLCRLASMVFIPLNDTTEARYAEIARKMLETGNWVTPLHDYGVPFWAKPPLSTWLSAASMGVFGVNGFAARLPSLLLSIAVLFLVWQVARPRDKTMAWNAVLVLSTCAFFILNAGVVMTDPALLFGISLSFAAFWLTVGEGRRSWRYAFFIGLGLGLLAKGPIALIVTGMPLFAWVLVRNQWRLVWQRLPWLSGSVLMLAIAAPWYALAEWRTPGFLNYFIMGEHVHRFLEPSWQGDKYGFAHASPRGMIWLYAAAAIFPWLLSVWAWLLVRGRALPSYWSERDGYVSFLLWFALLPLVFFTFARNIIYPYVLPGLPAFALLYADLARRSDASAELRRWFVLIAWLTGCLLLLTQALFLYKPQWIAKSQQPLVAAWIAEQPEPGSLLVYWEPGIHFSAQFYSHGRSRFTLDEATLCRLYAGHERNYLVHNARIPNPLPQWVSERGHPVNRIRIRNDVLTLYRLDGDCPS